MNHVVRICVAEKHIEMTVLWGIVREAGQIE